MSHNPIDTQSQVPVPVEAEIEYDPATAIQYKQVSVPLTTANMPFTPPPSDYTISAVNGPLVPNITSYNQVLPSYSMTASSIMNYQYKNHYHPEAEIVCKKIYNLIDYTANPSNPFPPPDDKKKRTKWDEPAVVEDPKTAISILCLLAKILSSINRNPQEMLKQLQAIMQPQTLKAPDLPESLKFYVKKAFDKCAYQQERDYMKIILKQVLENAYRLSKLFGKNWEEEEPPKLPRESLQGGVQQMLIAKRALLNSLSKQSLNKQNEAKEVNRLERKKKEEGALKLGWNFKALRAGTSTAVEKPYTKITSEPNPNEIRPKKSLKRTLKLIKKKWKAKEANYEYVNDQLRSIRADLYIQKAKGKFVVKVYESHARIALENHDIIQFKQCQAQLEMIYRTTGNRGHREEFLAYRLMFLILENLKIETIKLIKEFNLKDKANPYVKHALKLRVAYNDDNYARCFKLYKNAPNKGSYLIEIYIDKIRDYALKAICKSYGDYVPVRHVADLLCFRHSDKCRDYLRKAGTSIILGAICNDDDQINCRESQAIISAIKS